ncbi:MAG: hypothetical protein HFG34_11980 [Eubacterium sp.]|nr:hypothetical protein [Eubacterium sp.]
MRLGRNLIVFLAAAGVQLAIGWIYDLSTGLSVCLTVGGCLALKRIRFHIHQEKEFEQEYGQVVTYLEQLLCSYRRLGHTGRAMEDCSSLFEPKSRMGGAIQRAKHVFMTGEGVEDGAILEAAFAEIEKEYDSRRMKIIHTFLCSGDRTGSDSQGSLDILLEDLEFWKSRTSVYEKRKKFIKTECSVAAGLAAVLCYVSRLLTPEELGLHISDNPIYQISTTVVLLSLWWLIALIYRKLSLKWLDSCKNKGEEEERLEKLYQTLIKEPSASGLSAHVAKRVLGRYVRQEFPYWLMIVTLYLQTESGYQALKKSMEQTGGIFRQEIQILTEKIYDSPRDLQPYLEFFGKLELSEVQTGMKILYSVSTNGYEDSRRQLDFLVAQSNRLMDRSEVFMQNNKMAGMGLLKQLPMVLSSVKLLLDLIHLLTMTMGRFQNLY